MEPAELDALEALPLATRLVRPERLVVRDLSEMDRATSLGGPLNYAWFELLLHAAAKPIWERGVGRRSADSTYASGIAPSGTTSGGSSTRRYTPSSLG